MTDEADDEQDESEEEPVPETPKPKGKGKKLPEAQIEADPLIAATNARIENIAARTRNGEKKLTPGPLEPDEMFRFWKELYGDTNASVRIDCLSPRPEIFRPRAPLRTFSELDDLLQYITNHCSHGQAGHYKCSVFTPHGNRTWSLTVPVPEDADAMAEWKEKRHEANAPAPQQGVATTRGMEGLTQRVLSEAFDRLLEEKAAKADETTEPNMARLDEPPDGWTWQVNDGKPTLVKVVEPQPQRAAQRPMNGGTSAELLPGHTWMMMPNGATVMVPLASVMQQLQQQQAPSNASQQQMADFEARLVRLQTVMQGEIGGLSEALRNTAQRAEPQRSDPVLEQVIAPDGMVAVRTARGVEFIPKAPTQVQQAPPTMGDHLKAVTSAIESTNRLKDLVGGALLGPKAGEAAASAAADVAADEVPMIAIPGPGGWQQIFKRKDSAFEEAGTITTLLSNSGVLLKGITDFAEKGSGLLDKYRQIQDNGLKRQEAMTERAFQIEKMRAVTAAAQRPAMLPPQPRRAPEPEPRLAPEPEPHRAPEPELEPEPEPQPEPTVVAGAAPEETQPAMPTPPPTSLRDLILGGAKL